MGNDTGGAIPAFNEVFTTKDGTQVAAWMVTANRRVWDLPGFLATGEAVDAWRLFDNYRTRGMKPGDPVLLWLAGNDTDDPAPGIYALGIATSEPYEDHGDPDDPAWGDAAEAAKVRPYIDLNLPQLDAPLHRSDLRADPRLKRLEVLRAPQMANPLVVTPEEMAAIDEHLGGNLHGLIRAASNQAAAELWSTDVWAVHYSAAYEDLVSWCADRTLTVPYIPVANRSELVYTDRFTWCTGEVDADYLGEWDELADRLDRDWVTGFYGVSVSDRDPQDLTFAVADGWLVLTARVPHGDSGDGSGVPSLSTAVAAARLAAETRVLVEAASGSGDDTPRVLVEWDGHNGTARVRVRHGGDDAQPVAVPTDPANSLAAAVHAALGAVGAAADRPVVR